MKSSASSIDFSAVTARYIRVVISSGYNNHASCAEFVIGKRNTSASTMAESLFEDDLWTTLKSSVTQTTINNVGIAFINPNETAAGVELPAGSWKVLLNGETVAEEPFDTVSGEQLLTAKTVLLVTP